MKIFDRDGAVNFVDSNNVLVGFSTFQNCCENASWLLTRTMPHLIETAAEIDPAELDGYVFDVAFDGGDPLTQESLDGGGAVAFRLVNGDREAFLTLYNSQNGYYSHGFQMKDATGKKVRDGSV